MYRAEVHALSARQGETDATWESQKGSGTKIEHSHDVHFSSAAFTRLMLDPRFITVCTAIIGPNVQLHHNKIFIKPPEKGSPFPMHQDYPYFPHRDHSMISAIFHFDDTPVEKGCLCVYPGGHKLAPLDAIGSDHHLPEDRFPFAGATPIPAKAGDVVFFHYLLPHGSGQNVSDEPRTTLLVQLRDPADVPLNNDRTAFWSARNRADQKSRLESKAGLDPEGPRHRVGRIDAAVGADRSPVQDCVVLKVFDVSLNREAIVGCNVGEPKIGLGV